MKKFLKIFSIVLITAFAVLVVLQLFFRGTGCLTQPTQWKNKITGKIVGSPCVGAPFPGFLYTKVPLKFPDFPAM
jgi:hypothetical protein